MTTKNTTFFNDGLVSHHTHDTFTMPAWDKKLYDTSFFDRASFFSLLYKLGVQGEANHRFDWGLTNVDRKRLDFAKHGVTEASDNPYTTQEATEKIDTERTLNYGINWKGNTNTIVIPKNRVSLYGIIPGTVLFKDNNKGGFYIRVETMTPNGDNNEYTFKKYTGRDEDDFFSKLEDCTRQDILYVLEGGVISYQSLRTGQDVMYPQKHTVKQLHNYMTIMQHHTGIEKEKRSEPWVFNTEEFQWQVKNMQEWYLENADHLLLAGIGHEEGAFEEDLYSTKGLSNFKLCKPYITPDITFDDFMEDIVYGSIFKNRSNDNKSDTKTVFVNTAGEMWVTKFAKRNLGNGLFFNQQMDKTTFGLHVNTLQFGKFRLNFVLNRVLDQLYGTALPYMIAADLNNLKMKHLNNIPLATITANVQGPNANYYINKIYGSIGLQVGNPELHTILKFRHGTYANKPEDFDCGCA